MRGEENVPLVPAAGPDLEAAEAAEAQPPLSPALDLEGGGAAAAGAPLPDSPDRHSAANTATNALDGGHALSAVSLWLESNVPYLTLLLLVFLYEHCNSILTFVWLTSGLHFANTRMREQVALREKRSSVVLLGVLAMLLLTLASTLLMFRVEQIWMHLAFLMPAGERQPHVLGVLWAILVTDLLARYISMIGKIAVTLCLCATSHRRLKQLYRLSEMSVAVYRSALPMPQWYYWLLSDSGTAHFFASLITGLYLTFKLAAVLDQLRSVSSVCRTTMLQQSLYGRYATEAENNERGGDEACSICHDELSRAVVLSCKHSFCEDCVCEWLERERTCPLCRAVVSSGASYQSDGSAPLMCQVF